MTALAARSMGFKVAVLDPEPHCAASPLADMVIVGAFDDVEAARHFARCSAVVTYEIERIAPAVLQAVAECTPCGPGPRSWLASRTGPARSDGWAPTATRWGPLGRWRLAQSWSRHFAT